MFIRNIHHSKFVQYYPFDRENVVLTDKPLEEDIKKYFELEEKEFKGIKTIRKYQAKSLNLSWVTKETCPWVDFFIEYFLLVTNNSLNKDGGDEADWLEENEDLLDVCITIKNILHKGVAFAEKDGYIYIIVDDLIKNIDLKCQIFKT